LYTKTVFASLPGVTHMVPANPTMMERLRAKTARFFKKRIGEKR
jgi:hypothetical protein